MTIEIIWEALKSVAWLLGKRKKKCLLIIEDSQDDALLLSMILERMEGYEAETVDTAEAGLAVLRNKKHKIAFVDARLPMMDGFQFIEEIRSISPKTHIVMCCGMADDLIRIPVGRYVGVILKPPTVEAVEDCLNRTKM